MSARARGFESHSLRLLSKKRNKKYFKKVLDNKKKMSYTVKVAERQKSTAKNMIGQFGEVPKLAEGAPLERE